MAWEYRYRRGWTGVVILIAVGVIGLLANIDLLPPHLLREIRKI